MLITRSKVGGNTTATLPDGNVAVKDSGLDRDSDVSTLLALVLPSLNLDPPQVRVSVPVGRTHRATHLAPSMPPLVVRHVGLFLLDRHWTAFPMGV